MSESAESLPWRTGRKVGRTIYTITDWLTLTGDLIGVMDTPALARTVVEDHNHRVAPGLPSGPPRPDPTPPDTRPPKSQWRRK